MKPGPAGSFGAHLKALREAAGYTQEELATIAGLSVHGISALERGQRRRPHVDTVRALSAALELTGAAREALLRSARPPTDEPAVDELSSVPLPLQLTALLGRDADLQTLRPWLANPSVRLITLTGPGGVGKTRLALELAHTIAAERGPRVVFVSLAVIRIPALVAPAIAEAIGLADVPADVLPARVRVACADQPTWLVLDNFEQVLEAAPLAADLLSAAASLRLIVTSRAPLRIRGEREYAVGPLALDPDAGAMPLDDLARTPAVRLFVERVREVQPHFTLTATNGPTVAAICRRLDALPLALELAAPWMKVLTAGDLLAHLGRDVLLSTAAPRDLPERQQTMNATVAWSYHLLGPEEQRAFRRLGALPDRFPLEAASAVLAGHDASPAASGGALDAVAGLIDKSLLSRAPASMARRPLYQMLETVRAYAALALAASGERDDAMEGLARYYATQASLAAQGLLGSAQADWLDRVRDDLEGHRAAVTWLVEHGRPDEASRIAWDLMFFWIIRGHVAEGLRWYRRILGVSSLPQAAESRALLGAAVMSYWQGAHDRARADADRVLTIARRAGDLDMVAQAEHVLGHVEYAVGDMAAARGRFARSIDGFRALEIPWGTGLALSGLAEVALAMGDAAEAERLIDEAHSGLRSAGPWFLSLGLYVRATAALRRGDVDRAIALVARNLTGIRALHDASAFIYTLVPLAAAATLKGDHAWAARILGARDAVINRTGVALVDRPAHDLLDRADREARERLGPHRWADEYAIGRRTSIDALLKDIDAVLLRESARPSAS